MTFRTLAISPTSRQCDTHERAIKRATVQQNFTVAISPVLSHCRYLAYFVALSLSRPFCRTVAIYRTVKKGDSATKRARERQCDKTGEIYIVTVKFCRTRRRIQKFSRGGGAGFFVPFIYE